MLFEGCSHLSFSQGDRKAVNKWFNFSQSSTITIGDATSALNDIPRVSDCTKRDSQLPLPEATKQAIEQRFNGR